LLADILIVINSPLIFIFAILGIIGRLTPGVRSLLISSKHKKIIINLLFMPKLVEKTLDSKCLTILHVVGGHPYGIFGSTIFYSEYPSESYSDRKQQLHCKRLEDMEEAGLIYKDSNRPSYVITNLGKQALSIFED
jgi:hypothetical protein